MTSYEEARRLAEASDAQLLELYELYGALAETHGVCPFCPRSAGRRAPLDREIYIRGDGAERPYDENWDLAKDIGGFLLSGLGVAAETRSLLGHGAWFMRAEGWEPPAKAWLQVKAFVCPDHGEYLQAVHDEGGWWNLAAPRLTVRREGRLHRANVRYLACPAVIETVGPDLGHQEFEPCLRIPEWNGRPAEIGPCSWTCPLHGTWGVGDDGATLELEMLVERRVALGPVRRPPTPRQRIARLLLGGD